MNTRSVNETQKYAAEWASSLIGILKKKPLWIALEGDLGAGKTTFVQGFAQGLGVQSSYYVNSPTFTLINEYQAASGLKIIHVDLYRIEKAQEVSLLGLEEYDQSGTVILIEWPERVKDMSFDYRVQLHIEADESRKITLTKLL